MSDHESFGTDLMEVCADQVFKICMEPDVLDSIAREFEEAISEGPLAPEELFAYAYGAGMTSMLYEIVTGKLDVKTITMQRRKPNGTDEERPDNTGECSGGG